MIIERVGHQPFEIKRGDRVSYRGENVTVRGISKARNEVKIEHDKAVIKGGYWVPSAFIYPPLPDPELENKFIKHNLIDAIDHVNRVNKPADGWSEADRVPDESQVYGNDCRGGVCE